MSHRLLRSHATLLVVLGWLHVVVCTVLGFAPWFGPAAPFVPGVSQWGPWAFYASPALGLLVGALGGLAFFVASGVIRVLLDQRDLLEELVEAQQRLVRPAGSRQPGGASSATDPFDLTDLRRTEDSLP